MKQIEAQDQQALSILYDRYGGAVYSLAYRVTQNSNTAEEITQDVFMRVWEQAERWDSAKGKLVSWILTITRYASIDRLRKDKPSQIIQASIDDMPQQLAKEAVFHDPMWHDAKEIRQFIQQLPEEQAYVIELGFFKGMSHAEIANETQLPLGTVKTRIRLGLQKLREMWFSQER
jgi:RNA polymerase sigma-70 factor (ECF subfamily)